MLKRLVMVVCSLADFGICLRTPASASASGADDFYLRFRPSKLADTFLG